MKNIFIILSVVLFCLSCGQTSTSSSSKKFPEYLRDRLVVISSNNLDRSYEAYFNLNSELERSLRFNPSLVGLRDSINAYQEKQKELIILLSEYQFEVKGIQRDYEGEEEKLKLSEFLFGQNPSSNSGLGDGKVLILDRKFSAFMETTDTYFNSLIWWDKDTYQMEKEELLQTLRGAPKDEKGKEVIWADFHFKDQEHPECAILFLKIAVYQMEEVLLDLYKDRVAYEGLKIGKEKLFSKAWDE